MSIQSFSRRAVLVAAAGGDGRAWGVRRSLHSIREPHRQRLKAAGVWK